MDLNETTAEVIYRHPWELSRTACVLDVIGKYIDRMHKRKAHCLYINVGAGDLYFDKVLMSKYKKDEVYAVDIGYSDKEIERGGTEGSCVEQSAEKRKERRIHKFQYLEEIKEEKFDYGLMMDSLEYMEDDAEYVRKLSQKIKRGGYLFFTLPAFSFLFSDHDRNVKNLRRYDRQSFGALIDKIPRLEKLEDYYFYSSLFVVRLVQKVFHLSIDPEHKVTAGWEHPERDFVTRCLAGCLSLDFAVDRCLSKVGIRLPGLSMLVVCRKI